MKKTVFLSTVFAFMATFVMAQTPVFVPLDIDTNAITKSSFDVSAQAFGGGSGNWYVQVQARQVGTSTWLNSDTAMYSGTNIQITRTKDSLLANTEYEPRLVVYNASLVQVSTLTFPVIRTKPSPQPVTIGSAASVALLPQAGLRFTGVSSVGQQAFALGYPTSGGAPVTDTIFFGFTNSFSDTLLFLIGGPQYNYPSTRVIIQALDGSSSAFSPVIPAFISPAYTAGTMNMGTPFITKDSVRVNLNITSLGNAGGSSVLEILITDTLGPFVYQSNQLISNTGTVTIAQGGFLSNHYYRITALLTNSVNMTSTATRLITTLNVNKSDVTVKQQQPQDYVSYTVEASIDPKGSGDSSKVMKAELLEGNNVVDLISLALTDTGTITFVRSGQTPGTSKQIQVRVTNGAGLITTSGTITASMLAVGQPTMNPTASVKTTDSLYVGFNVTGLGIPLNPTLRVVIKNPTGGIILDSTRLVTATGIIGIGKGGLLSNTGYTITGTLSNTMMLGDTDVVTVFTKNVNPPTASIAIGAIGYTTYSVNVTTVANGTTDSSLIKKVYYYEDGVIVDSATSINPSFTRNGRNPGQSYFVKVQVINMANLSYTSNQTKITMLSYPENSKPIMGDLLADNASTARIVNISYGAAPGSTSTIRAIRKILQINYVDTLTVATGLINSGIIPLFIVNNCIGGYTTQITIIDEGLGGIVVGNMLQQNMPLPADPIVADIAQDPTLTTGTTLGITVFGSGEGNGFPTLKLWLYKNNTQVGSVFTTTVNSGTFEYPYSWNALEPSSEYKVVAEITATGATPSSVTRYFYTDAISGIKEIPEIAETQMVQVVNLLGQHIAKGEYKTVHASLLGSQTLFFITPFGDDGIVSGTTRKIWIP